MNSMFGILLVLGVHADPVIWTYSDQFCSFNRHQYSIFNGQNATFAAVRNNECLKLNGYSGIVSCSSTANDGPWIFTNFLSSDCSGQASGSPQSGMNRTECVFVVLQNRYITVECQTGDIAQTLRPTSAPSQTQTSAPTKTPTTQMSSTEHHALFGLAYFTFLIAV